MEGSSQVVEDDDAALGNQIAVITPALTRKLETCCAYYSYVSFHSTADGARGGSRVRGQQGDPQSGPGGRSDHNAPYVAKAERAIRPEAIAFGVFGLVAGLAVL